MNEVVLKTVSLSKRYDKAMAVDRVNIEIRQGEIYGLIGNNGAGKTTMLRMICGLVNPSGGELELFGERTPVGLAKARRGIGSFIEGPSVYRNMTATENLEVQKRYLGLKGRNEIREALEMFGLEDAGKERVEKFSFGMTQRLGLAMAFLGNPPFLVLDEPNVGADVQGNADLCETLRRCNRETHTTILLSGYNLTEISKVATRYGIIHEGKMLKQFTAEELEADCRAKNIDSERYFSNMIHVARTAKGAKR